MIYNGTLNASLSDYKCNSCTLYIALFVVILVTSIDISSVFIYIHWYLKKYPKILLPVKMRTLKSINIKIRPYLFNSMTNIKNFDPNVLSIDQVSFEKKILTVLFMSLNISKILIVQILFILFSIMYMHTLNTILLKMIVKLSRSN